MKLREYADYDATGLASLVNGELTRLTRQVRDEVHPRINAGIEILRRR